jgi:hypothetical protein
MPSLSTPPRALYSMSTHVGVQAHLIIHIIKNQVVRASNLSPSTLLGKRTVPQPIKEKQKNMGDDSDQCPVCFVTFPRCVLGLQNSAQPVFHVDCIKPQRRGSARRRVLWASWAWEKEVVVACGFFGCFGGGLAFPTAFPMCVSDPCMIGWGAPPALKCARFVHTVSHCQRAYAVVAPIPVQSAVCALRSSGLLCKCGCLAGGWVVHISSHTPHPTPHRLLNAFPCRRSRLETHVLICMELPTSKCALKGALLQAACCRRVAKRAHQPRTRDRAVSAPPFPPPHVAQPQDPYRACISCPVHSERSWSGWEWMSCCRPICWRPQPPTPHPSHPSPSRGWPWHYIPRWS